MTGCGDFGTCWKRRVGERSDMQAGTSQAVHHAAHVASSQVTSAICVLVDILRAPRFVKARRLRTRWSAELRKALPKVKARESGRGKN